MSGVVTGIPLPPRLSLARKQLQGATKETSCGHVSAAAVAAAAAGAAAAFAAMHLSASGCADHEHVMIYLL